MKIIFIMLISMTFNFLIILLISNIKFFLSKQNFKVSNVEEGNLELFKDIDYMCFEIITEKMERKGFTKTGDYISTSESINGYIRILKNFSENIKIVLMNEVNTKPEGITMVLETRYKDGDILVTTNKLQPTFFKDKDIIRYKHIVTKPEELLDKHRKHIKKFSSKEIYVNILRLDDKALFVSEIRDEMRIQERFGILKFDETKEYYYLTLFGANRALFKKLIYRWFAEGLMQKCESRFKTQGDKLRTSKFIDRFSNFSTTIIIFGVLVIIRSSNTLEIVLGFSSIIIGIICLKNLISSKTTIF